jgi:hypothetical protein
MARKKDKKPQPRNAVAVVARARNSAGPMRDRRKRRAKDREARELRESY